MELKYLYKLILFTILLTSCQLKNISTQNFQPKNKTSTALGKKVDSLLTPYVNKLRKLTDNQAGLAVGITKGNEIIYAKTFGYSNIEKGTVTDFNTVFHIASLSKPFAAFAIAKLTQQGKLELNDPIVKFIPELEMQGGNYNLITIKHILTHTSGIPANISTDDWTNPSYGEDALNENIEALKRHPLNFEPGLKFSYSNSAFDLLGIVINRVSGMPYSEFIKKNILEPAGMTKSTFKKPKDLIPHNWAVPYSYGLKTQEWNPYPYNEKLLPSSGMLTTLSDMCKWAQLHQGRGEINGKIVLEKEYFDLIVTPHFDTPWNDKIGLSWYLQSYLDHPIIMHSGQDTGFEAIIYIYPEDDISIIVMSNRDFSRTGRIINAASEIVFDKEIKDFQISAKYKFAEMYNKNGIEKAKEVWNTLKTDTTDIYIVNDGDILTTGAILENGRKWSETREVLEFYNDLNNNSTYSWRLLGNANLNIGDTLTAMNCYRKCLEINPNYEKAKLEIKKLE
jgi:CubicO group peptidase (beta-lactamase class C family)